MNSLQPIPSLGPSQESSGQKPIPIQEGLLALEALTEETRRAVDRQTVLSNLEIMRSAAPGGMIGQMMGESRGGNAGRGEEAGKTYKHVAANFIADMETGEILSFTNSQEELDRIVNEGRAVSLGAFFRAMPEYVFKEGGGIFIDAPKDWKRPDKIVRTVAYTVDGKLEEAFTARAAMNIQKSVEEFNNEEHPFHYPN